MAEAKLDSKEKDDDSGKDATSSNQNSSSKKPNFLGRIGAALGLMKASKFADADEDEERLGSASTVKSRLSKQSRAQSPDSSDESVRPRSSASFKKPQSKSSSKRSQRPESSKKS